MNPRPSPDQPQLVHDFVDSACALRPGTIALRDPKRTWTVEELRHRSVEMAQWLLALEVQPGDRIVAQAPSDGELVSLFLASSRIGAIFVPLNPAMKPFQLGGVITDADPVLVVGGAGNRDGLSSATQLPIHDMAEATHTGDPGELAVARPAPDDIAVIVYTSGSTSLPKGVVEPHEAMVFATLALVDALGYRADDVVFCRFPLSWDYGLYKVLMCLASGSQIVLADQGSDLQLLDSLSQCQATIIPVVPSLASMILTLSRHRTGAIAPVRLVTNTGAALPPAVIAGLRDRFPGASVVRQFGQTECKRVSVMPPEEGDDRPGSVGVPLPGTRVTIESATGEELPRGEVGEIVVRGPHVMAGYWRNVEQTTRSFAVDDDGTKVLHTGDYGSMDADGYLYFEGRRDDMFKRKGIRVSALEIEAAALDIPGVHEAAVLPPTQTSDLAVFVVADLEGHSILRALADRLEPAKVPATCVVLDRMPLTPHGKVSMDALRTLSEGVRA